MEMRIFEIPTPLWLSDTFIFGEIEDIGFCYIKVNYRNRIEEIGLDFSGRFHHIVIEDIINDKNCIKASKLHRSIFNRIGMEYWQQKWHEKYIKTKQ